jgi:glucose-6-phosphate dehydrogenase assembly protein OpcA
MELSEFHESSILVNELDTRKIIMPTKESVDAFIKGESLPVEAGAIEKELAALWQAMGESEDEATRSITRACQLNLIIYAPHEGVFERAAGALTDLMRRHPARAITLIAEREAETPGGPMEELAAYISAPSLSSNEQAKEKRGEQITIAAQEKVVDRLPELVTPLLLKDLPVALWWKDDLPEEDALFERLVATSRHLIYDSAFCRDVGNEFSRARALSVTWESGLLGDLNWRRLAHCRDLVARALESAEVKPWIDHIEKISFDVTTAIEGDAHFAQPLLLLGWLANQLDLKINEPLTPVAAEAAGDSSDRAFHTNWEHNGREVIGAITLHKPAHEHETTAGITVLQLLFRQDGETLAFSLQRDSTQPQAKIRVVKGEHTLAESAVDFPEIPLAELAAQELDRTLSNEAGRDVLYENALRFATQLI